MIDVALLSVIRRWHLREGVSIREIARRTQLSRNTIRKYLADGTLQPAYPKRKSPSKLDPYSAMLASWLERESTRGRKQRRNWRQLFDDLVALGYRGSWPPMMRARTRFHADQARRQVHEKRCHLLTA